MGERIKRRSEVFKPLKKLTAFLLALALTFTTLSTLTIAPVSAATLSDEESLQIIKDRIKEKFLGSDTYRVVSGSDIFGYISKSMEYANSIQPNGSWSDVNYADHTNSANGTLWSPYHALYRITAMAMGYNQQGNEAYQNPFIKDAIESALTYWDSVKPSSTNWWENEIGQAMCMGVTGIFMEGIISKESLDICVNYNRGRLDTVGANGVWRTQDYLYKMLVRNNYPEITNGISTLAKTLAVDETGTATEAVQADSSFYCHGAKLYSEGYGMAQFNMVATWVGYTSGTNFAFSEEGLKGLEFYILDGTRWMIRGEFGFLYLGYRRYNTMEGVGSYAADILPGMMVMAQYDTDPERRAKYQKVVDNIKGTSATNGLVGNKHFWRSDYSSHMRDNFGIMTKMSSSRVNGGEYRSTFRPSVGNEIYWNAAGTTAIFVNGQEYTDLAPAFDWSHYPGTTAPYEKMPYSLECRFNANSSFVGGVSDGMYGASVFTQDMDSTLARKGYFYFDNEMVALGSGISSTRPVEVHTTINQGIAKENASVDGVLVPKGTAPITYTNPTWAYNDQIGYVFPENSNVSVSNMDQTANWLNQPAQTKQAFTLFLNHGINPNNASYEYIVVPGKASAEVEVYAQNIPVQILSNTTSLQAVRNEGLKQTQMIFYNAGSLEYRSGATITVNQPCLAIVDESSGTPKVTVANPDIPGLVVDVKIIDQTAGETLYGRYNVGSGIHLGESITQILTNVPLTANNIVASSFLPGHASFNAVDDRVDTSWRSEPDESQYLVYNIETPKSYVDKVTINWGDNYAKEYIVQYSMDNVNWTDGCLQWNGSGGQEVIDLPYVKTNYIRILLLSSNNNTGYEIIDLKVNNSVNRALSKATSASGSANSGQVAQYAVDGEGSSRFAANNSATAWWQVNLGQKTPVRTIRISWESTYATSYKIQKSDDGSTWTDVNTYTCTKPGWQVLDIPEGSINSQYIRLQCVSRVGTSYGMSFYEFEVFSEPGIPAPSPDYGGRTNLAYNKTVTMESYWTGSATVESTRTTTIPTDGNYGTKDSTGRGTAGTTTRSFYIDLGESKQVNEVKLYWEVNTADVYLQYSDDAVNWTPITHVARAYSKNKKDDIIFKPVTARYIRVYGVIAEQYGLAIYEIEAYGDYSYKLNHHSITLNKGENIDLSADLSPYASSDVIEFKSYNTDTVTVTTPGTTGTPDTGEQATYSASLNAVSGGTSVIIARHSAGSEYDLCTVKVNTYKRDLQALYDTAVQLDQNDYISSSWSDSNIDNVLLNANSLLSDNNATQRQVDTILQNLQISMNALEEKANKSVLITIISQIKTLKQADYTPESWVSADFENLLPTADSVYFNENATQQDIDSIIDVLITARNGLVSNPSNTTAPSEVTGLTVVAGDGQLTLTWINPTDLDFDHVVVTGSAITAKNLGGGVHSTTVTGLTNGTTYTIVLQTVDTDGNISTGVSVNGTPTDLIIPDTTAPSEVTASTVVAGDGQLTLTWINPIDLDFDHVIVTGSAITAKNLGGGANSTTVTGLTNGTTYTIVLQTVDTNGNISTGVSVNGIPADIIIPDTTAPSEVTGSMVIAGDGHLTLIWINPTDLDFDHVIVTGSAITAKNIAGGVRSTTVMGLTNGTTYTIVLQTVDTSGNTSTGTSVSGIPVSPISAPVSSQPSNTEPVKAVVEGHTIKAEAPVVDKATGIAATVIIQTEELNKALSNAVVYSDGTKTVAIEIPKVEGAEKYTVQLPKSILTSDNKKVNVEIKTELGTMVIPENMLKTVDTTIASKIEISISESDIPKLDGKALKAIGNRPVVDLEVKLDGKVIAWMNTNAPVIVKIPYNPTSDELANLNYLVVWYINNGKVEQIQGGKYVAEEKAVVFTTTHFSNYTIAFIKKSFSDVKKNSWMEKPIEVLASNGIIEGTSETNFNPNDKISKGEFVGWLVKTLGLNADFNTNFIDVKETNKYYKEIGISKALGITVGNNGKFSPKDKISRQDMAVLTIRALKAAKLALKVGKSKDISKFTDAKKVSKYAIGDVATMVKMGLLKSNSNSTLNPSRNLTRAEAAQVLYQIYLLK